MCFGVPSTGDFGGLGGLHGRGGHGLTALGSGLAALLGISCGSRKGPEAVGIGVGFSLLGPRRRSVGNGLACLCEGVVGRAIGGHGRLLGAPLRAPRRGFGGAMFTPQVGPDGWGCLCGRLNKRDMAIGAIN